MMEEALTPFNHLQIDSYEWHVFRALLSGTQKVLTEIIVSDEQRLYKIDYIEREEDDFQADFVDPLAIEFYHEIEDEKIDLVFVDQTAANKKETLNMVEEAWPPFQLLQINSREGHVFRALLSGAETVIAEFAVRNDQRRYMFHYMKKEEDLDEL